MEHQVNMQGGGTLLWRQEGNQVQIQAQRPEDGRGLYKVWLTGAGDGSILLGTMMPQGGRLSLRRTLPLRELERMGCWPIQGAKAPLSFTFPVTAHWYAEPHPEKLISDPVAKQQLKGAMLCQRHSGGLRLAAPFRTDQPVALDTLFCLAQVTMLEGTPHLIWNFNREGWPQVQAVKKHYT